MTKNPPRHDPPAPRTPPRLRGDLHWVRVPGDLGDRWRVKDPITLEYHEFGPDERFLLEQFDGRTGPGEVRRRYADRFAPRVLRAEALERFVADAHRRGLMIADGDQATPRTLACGADARRRTWLAVAASLLMTRLPGIDPTPLLRVLTPAAGWWFSPGVAAAVAAAAAATLLMLISRAGVLAERLPAAEQLLEAGNLGLLLGAFIVVKAIHELAHAVACRRVGARCHEIGLLLIAFVPCLYCDVSDTWMVRSRWRRMMVSAAGMYAELIVAIAAAWLWAFAAEGVAAAVLLNVMIACGVGTLLLNANPLLKLDGYYLLSDGLGVSNLHERSRRALLGPAVRWFRTPATRRPWAPVNFPLACYGVLSIAYRGFVWVVIAWAAHTLLARWGVRPLGDALVAVSTAGLAAPAVIGFASTVRSPSARRSWRWGRMMLAAGGIVAVAVTLLALPAPRTVTAPAVFEMTGARPAAAVAPGRLVWVVREGARVAAGEPLAELHDPSLARRRARLAGRVARLNQRAESLRRRADRTPSLLAQAPTALAAARQAQRDLDKLDEQLRRLIIAAPVAGTVFGCARPCSGRTDEQAGWRGRLIDRENLGAWVEAGDVLCLVSPNPDLLTATMALDPADALGVRPGLPTRLLAYQSNGPVVRAPLGEVARAEARPDPVPRRPGGAEVAAALAGGGPLVLARIDLPAGVLPGVRHGSLGRCKIETSREAVAVRVRRWLAGVFPFAF